MQTTPEELQWGATSTTSEELRQGVTLYTSSSGDGLGPTRWRYEVHSALPLVFSMGIARSKNVRFTDGVEGATSCTKTVKPGETTFVAGIEVDNEQQDYHLQLGFRLKITKRHKLSFTEENIDAMNALSSSDREEQATLKRRSAADVSKHMHEAMDEDELSATEVLVGGEADGSGWEPATLLARVNGMATIQMHGGELRGQVVEVPENEVVFIKQPQEKEEVIGEKEVTVAPAIDIVVDEQHPMIGAPKESWNNYVDVLREIRCVVGRANLNSGGAGAVDQHKEPRMVNCSEVKSTKPEKEIEDKENQDQGELSFAKFAKMSKIGVPKAALREKMKTEGISDTVIDRFFEKCSDEQAARRDLNAIQVATAAAPSIETPARLQATSRDVRVLNYNAKAEQDALLREHAQRSLEVRVRVDARSGRVFHQPEGERRRWVRSTSAGDQQLLSLPTMFTRSAEVPAAPPSAPEQTTAGEKETFPSPALVSTAAPFPAAVDPSRREAKQAEGH